MEEWLEFRHQASLKRAHRVLVQWQNLADCCRSREPVADPEASVKSATRMTQGKPSTDAGSEDTTTSI